MERLQKADNANWESGKVSGCVYHGDQAMVDFQTEVIKKYALSNPLHADVWPSVAQFEAEVVNMTANMVNGGDKNVCGASTNGGTESIIMAVRTHLRWAQDTKNITHPEIVAALTAHAGLDKVWGWIL